MKLNEKPYTVKINHTPHFKVVINLAHLSYTRIQICTPWQADWQPSSTLVSKLLTSHFDFTSIILQHLFSISSFLKERDALRDKNLHQWTPKPPPCLFRYSSTAYKQCCQYIQKKNMHYRVCLYVVLCVALRLVTSS